jgi:hypothetical protein
MAERVGFERTLTILIARKLLKIGIEKIVKTRKTHATKPKLSPNRPWDAGRVGVGILPIITPLNPCISYSCCYLS